MIPEAKVFGVLSSLENSNEKKHNILCPDEILLMCFSKTISSCR